MKIDGKWTFVIKEKPTGSISTIIYAYIFDQDIQDMFNK